MRVRILSNNNQQKVTFLNSRVGLVVSNMYLVNIIYFVNNPIATLQQILHYRILIYNVTKIIHFTFLIHGTKKKALH